jgi:hypothetical protein
MATLEEKIQHALDEAHILITGIQLLVGFKYRAVFEKGFETMPPASQYLGIVSLILLLLALMLIMSPVPYHRIAENGQDTERFNKFIRQIMKLALAPFALGLSLDCYLVGEKVGGSVLGLVLGLAAGLMAIFFWYAFEYSQRRKGPNVQDQTEKPSSEGSKLSEKVDHVLAEARVILPGAQALLGFQLITVLAEGFEKLQPALKYLHLLSLMLIALSTILLMSPAAYHRIVERGEDTERFLKLAGRFVVASMIPLALGVSLNFFVVVYKVTASGTLSIFGTALLLIMFFGFWFGYTFYERQRRAEAA